MKLIVEEVVEKNKKEPEAKAFFESEKNSPTYSESRFRFHPKTRQQKIIILVIVLIIFELLFLLPLFMSSWFFVKSAQSVASQQIERASEFHNYGNTFLSTSKVIYRTSRPLLSFFYLARFPDNLVSLHEDAGIFIENSIKASKSLKIITASIFSSSASDKNPQLVPVELAKLKIQVDNMAKHSRKVEQNLSTTLPFFDMEIEKIDMLASFMEDEAKIIGTADTLLKGGARAQYVVFFYNNMELRPGGGFIGSFAILTFDKYALSEFTVFDVYDADGQLKNHLKPPGPISRYLRQPHYYLRDSNFTPDFPENVKTAEYFLERELGITNIDGAIALTTTGLSYVLSAFEPIYVPDLKESITKDNFYLKAQQSSEEGFFPGSKQKKNFLSSLSRQMMFSINKADQGRLSLSLLQALQEKHLVIFAKESEVEENLSKLRWGGTLVSPTCVHTGVSCQLNHIFPVDANLGVNKANAFVSRLIKQSILINKEGRSVSKIVIIFNNKSPEDAFPGGDYLNYFQLYIPSDAENLSVVSDGDNRASFDVKRSGNFQVIGFPITIKAMTQGVIEVSYTEGKALPKGQSIYQLLVQKQIGLINTDFALEIILPTNIKVVDTNFASLAKGNRIIYNTVLSSDKLFLIELERNTQ